MKKLTLIFALPVLFYGIMSAQGIQKKSVNVTVYNDNLGVVKDVRNIEIPSGKSEIRITDVAQKIDPTSVHIKLKGAVLEQNYQYDLVSLMKILSKYVDKNVQLTSDKETVSGKLLSASGQNIVLQKSDGGLLMIPDIDKYQISVGSLPEGLITMPTLVWMVDSKKAGRQDVELSYQTSGMDWHAEYVAVLNDKDTKTDLNSWVSIENNSGATYENAKLKLIAGEVHRVQDEGRYYPKQHLRKETYAEAPTPQFEEKAFFEYHIYDLQRPTTLRDNETKQISLFEASDISITKKYLYKSGYYYGGDNKVNVIVEFKNEKKNNLGMPLPAGKVRLYKSDGSTIEFIGEDKIDHTPKNETLKLKVGDAFDIVAEEKEKSHKKISDNVHEFVYEVKLTNRKDEDVTVEVDRNLGLNWEILETNIDYEKKNSREVIFKVPVKKDSETTLTYKVRFVY